MDNKEALYHRSEDSTDPPPAYHEVVGRPSSTHTDDLSTIDGFSTLDGASTLDSASTLNSDSTLNAKYGGPSGGPFPNTFNFYYKKAGFKKTTFHIGEHADQPLFTMILHTGWKGISMTLHRGADDTSPTLATAAGQGVWSNNSLITLHDTADREAITEQVKVNVHWKGTNYSFSFSIPQLDDKPRVETFEWRLSHGSEVKSLDKHAWGWKLVRVNRESSIRKGGKRAERDAGETSDGKEIVAVWADNSKFSKNKLGKFQFMGSGATGEMGDDWALMSVVSILRIWQSQHYGGGGSAAASNAASSASAAAVASS